LYSGSYSDTGTVDDMRDIFFRTEVFDWPAGTEIQLYRNVFFSDSLAIAHDGALWDSSFKMKYIIELVDDSTNFIRTVETIEFSPILGKFVVPGALRIYNDSSFIRDVYLRVRKDASDTLSVDSLTAFEEDQYDGEYDAQTDSFYVLKQAPGTYIPTSNNTIFDVSDPFPDPASIALSGKINLLVKYPKGADFKVEIIDILGRVIDSRNIISSSSWNRVIFDLPKAEGIYFVKVSAGNFQKICPFTVTN
jgi:hypothetical protein